MTSGPPLRVLLVMPVAVAGGAGEVALSLIRHADRAGLEIHVLVVHGGPLVERLGALGCSYEVVEAGRLRDPRETARAMRAIGRTIRRFRPDVVYATEPKGHLYGALPAALLGRRLVWRQPKAPDRRDAFDLAATLLPAARVVVASEYVANLQRTLPGSPRVEILPPGIELERFEPRDSPALRERLGVPADAPFVGIVGRLQRWKGQTEFLRAARNVADERPDAWFGVVGGAEMGWEDAAYPEELRREAGRLGIADRVVFSGQVGDVHEWFAALDVVVNASDVEPFGLVLLEAMAMGKPVVAFANAGPAEIIDDRRTGLLAAERTPESFAARILELVEDPGLRRALGAAARERVVERYSDARMARDFGAMFRDVAGARDGRMRVLVVIPVAVEGGAGEVALGLLRNAEAVGIDPHVVVLRPGPLVDGLRAMGVPFEVHDAGRLRDVRRTARAVAHLVAAMRRVDPDIVFSNEPKAHLYAGPAAALTGRPACWAQPQVPGRRDPFDAAATAVPAASVIVASDYVARVQRRMPRSAPVRVVRPGIDHHRFRRRERDDAIRAAHGVAPDAPFVGIVGRLQRWKGQLEFVRAAALVAQRRPDARFAVVGGADMGWEEADYPDELRREVERLGLGDRVTFTGHVAGVQDWYAALDVVVNASDVEPFGLVVIEAMAMGKPVVALDNAGPAEIVDHGRTGLLVPERTPEAFAAAVLRLLDDPALTAAIGEAARADALGRYGDDRMARDFRAVFDAAVRR